MDFKKWFESYSQDLVYLRNYLRSKPIDLQKHAYYFMNWNKAPEIIRRAGFDVQYVKKLYNSDNDEIYEVLDAIEAKMTDEEKSSFIDELMQGDPAEVPTWGYLDMSRVSRPDTWLIHFSDDADDIAREGFAKGVYDPSELGLTHYLHSSQKEYPGYNFAFYANSRDAIFAANKSKYGKHAVMFQSAGIDAYHYGDEEHQIIFWGPSVDQRRIVLLLNHDDWCVATTLGDCIHTGEFENVVSWVINHHHQYRRIIMGH